MTKVIRSLILGNSRVQRSKLASMLEVLEGIEVVYSVRCSHRATARISTGDIDAVFLLLADDDGLEDSFLLSLSSQLGPEIVVIPITSGQKVDSLRRLRAASIRPPHFFSMPTSRNEESVFVQDLRRALRLKPAPMRQMRSTSVLVSKSPEMVCVTSSTGGPEALGQLLSELGGDFELPILITQHMPEAFVDNMCENLSRHAKRVVLRAVDGCPVAPGGIYVAPGDAHLCVRAHHGHYVCALDYGPPSAGCRPAGNVMLESAANATSGALLAVCLTGMGHDGTHGMARVRESGGVVIVQDEASSVVWGMPGSIVEHGHHHYILPLDEIAQKILAMLGQERGDNVSCAS